jgi:hypothetical protein
MTRATIKANTKLICALKVCFGLSMSTRQLSSASRSSANFFFADNSACFCRNSPFKSADIAVPGAGKSHFIKQLARKMEADRVQAVTFNMATMQSTDDMAQPVDELRNLKVNDRFPLLFLDEFDSDLRDILLCCPCCGKVPYMSGIAT